LKRIVGFTAVGINPIQSVTIGSVSVPDGTAVKAGPVLVVTQRGDCTGIAALIIVDLIAVVTAFISIDDPITTVGEFAIEPAGIGGFIGIVLAIITGLDALTQVTVAAGGGVAVIEAGVVLKFVPIITVFHAHVDKAVATKGLLAGVGAGIRILPIAIVAGFHLLANPIATPWALAAV
tara:strand:- start:368 stop:901 length:534 start_codon:yes stop_codon:yes gene_type:complete